MCLCVCVRVCDMCVCLQTTIERLPAPYGDCWDTTIMDNSNNAYADRYPVNYSTVVSIRTVQSPV